MHIHERKPPMGAFCGTGRNEGMSDEFPQDFFSFSEKVKETEQNKRDTP